MLIPGCSRFQIHSFHDVNGAPTIFEKNICWYKGYHNLNKDVWHLNGDKSKDINEQKECYQSIVSKQWNIGLNLFLIFAKINMCRQNGLVKVGKTDGHFDRPHSPQEHRKLPDSSQDLAFRCNIKK